jgi:hypothetical protein
MNPLKREVQLITAIVLLIARARSALVFAGDEGPRGAIKRNEIDLAAVETRHLPERR